MKDKEAREIVLHDHLIELGFATFIEQSRDGHLFMTPNAKGDSRGPRRTVKNRLTDFARQVVQDPALPPTTAEPPFQDQGQGGRHRGQRA